MRSRIRSRGTALEQEASGSTAQEAANDKKTRLFVCPFLGQHRLAQWPDPATSLQPKSAALFFHNLSNEVNLSDGVRLSAVPEHEPVAQCGARD
jgi:hypothetical protein